MGDGVDSSLTEVLQALPHLPEEQIPLARLALLIGAVSLPDVDVSRYEQILDDYIVRVRAGLGGSEDTAPAQLGVLRHLLVDEEGYRGDTQTYDALENANLVRVMDRRHGLPITLGIIYWHVARGAGLDVAGLNFPGHFLLRLTHGAERIIFDPFDGARVLEAPDLRNLLKKLHGPRVELAAEYYTPVGARDILIRLQNNVKRRQIETSDYTGALRTIETMRLIDPNEYRLLLDAGVLYARVGQNDRAIALLADYADRFPPGHANRIEAQQLIETIRLS